MTRQIIAACLVAALAGLTAIPAHADQTITFRVPVRLTKIYPDVKKFVVSCTLRHTSNMAANYGFGRADLSINKSYIGTVNVPVKVPDSVATQVNAWTCEVGLFHNGPACTPAVNSPVAACKAKAGTQLVTKVQGQLVLVGAGRLKWK